MRRIAAILSAGALTLALAPAALADSGAGGPNACRNKDGVQLNLVSCNNVDADLSAEVEVEATVKP